MSEPENFIARWSRRKREAAQEAEAPPQPATAPEAAAENAQTPERQPEQQPKEGDATVARGGMPEPAFDPASLPSLDSITADSDIRAFLAPGVPAALTRAALRRAWAADPGIRDFVGLADYDWDFVTPGAITGFGSLEMTDELRRHIARIVGRNLASEEAGSPAPTAAGRPLVETSFESDAATAEVPTRATPSNRGKFQGEADPTDDERHNCEPVLQRDRADTAPQHDPEKPDNDQVIAKRPRGSALPE